MLLKYSIGKEKPWSIPTMVADSDAMANIVPRSWRTVFRHDVERDSEVMSSSVPI